jgi:hypothetical protein
MRLSHLFAISAVSALVVSTNAAQAQYYRHHDHGNGAAVGAALGAGVFLGALAAGAARDRDVYVEEGPPPPPRVYSYDEGPAEGPKQAIAACRTGLLDAARQYGAYDAEIGDVYSVRETPNGHRVRAEITIDYPRGDSRTSNVTCETEDGILVSAHNEH